MRIQTLSTVCLPTCAQIGVSSDSPGLLLDRVQQYGYRWGKEKCGVAGGVIRHAAWVNGYGKRS